MTAASGAQSPKTRLAFGECAYRDVVAGVDALAAAVGVTLGPAGRNVAIDVTGGAPKITQDGVTVATAIDLPDIFHRLSARLVKQASAQTSRVSGDGTTTTVLLLQSILHEGLRLVAAGVEPVTLRLELEAAAATADAALAAMALPAEGQLVFERIATVAAADPEIGRILGEAMAWAGSEGTIAIIEGRKSATEVVRTEGFLFDRGYLSPAFLTNDARDEVVLDDPAILLTDQKISTAGDLLPLLELLLQAGKREVVVIAREFGAEPLGLLAQNTARGPLSALAVNAPEFAERRTAALDDLALFTGATLLSEEGGYRLSAVTLDQLGRAWQVVSRRDRTAVVGRRGDPARVSKRISQIKGELAFETVRFNREKLEARLTRLANRVVEIRVGAPTAIALKEKKVRFDDAHQALRAARAEGILPGGGVALLAAAAHLHGAENAGATVLRRAMEQPLHRLVASAGEEGALVAAEIRCRQQASRNPFLGYDVLRRSYADLLDAGIVDAALVTRGTLRHAVSIATQLLTCGVLIAHVPIDEARRRRSQGTPWPGLAAGNGFFAG